MKHITLMQKGLMCLHCGTEKNLAFPISFQTFAKQNKAFTKAHKDCLPTYTPPTPNMNHSEETRVAWWLFNGERGMSSETMVAVCYDPSVSHHRTHPHDPDDFRRCYLLVQAVPEIRDRFDKLAEISPVWANLTAEWDTLTDLYQSERYPELYNKMMELGC